MGPFMSLLMAEERRRERLAALLRGLSYFSHLHEPYSLMQYHQTVASVVPEDWVYSKGFNQNQWPSCS